MLQWILRSIGYAAAATSVGVRAGSAIERRLLGANAVTRRALMARRSSMALLFRRAKLHRRRN